MPASVGGWGTGMSWGEGRFEESHCDPLWMGSDRKERPQQVFCYRDRDETGGGSGLDSQEQ